MNFLLFSLAVVTVIFLWRIAILQHFINGLSRSITDKRPYLSRTPILLTGRKTLDRLRDGYNALLEENASLHKEQQDRLSQIKTTMDNLHEAVLMVNYKNVIIYNNEYFTRIYDSQKSVIGQRLEGSLRSSSFLEFIRELRSGIEVQSREIEFVLASRTVWLEVSGSRIASRNESGNGILLFVLHDITRLKQLEKVRRDFVANVSHELRTPVTIIKGFTETLIEEHDSLPEASRFRFLGKINKNVHRLHQLLEDLLVLSRLESGAHSTKPEQVDVNSLIIEIKENFQNRFEDAKIHLELQLQPALPDLHLDALRIAQALENLVENALKYAKGMTRLLVQTKFITGEGFIEIIVEDDGCGIPEMDQPHIFERFYRVDKGRSRELGGTGLGLSIVKHIIQSHGGTIKVRSRVGEFCRFTIVLPLQQIEI